MSTEHQNLSSLPSNLPSGKGRRFGLVRARWNEEITKALWSGARDLLLAQGVGEEDIVSVEVPGSFELPLAAKLLLGRENLDAVICLGCVIKGETSHNEYINQSVATALQQLSLAKGKPCVFGVLTPNTMEQALDRAGGKHGNKGVEAAATALEMVALAKELSEQKQKIGF